MKKLYKIFISIITAAVLLLNSAAAVCAEEEDKFEFEDIPAESVYIFEMETEEVIYERESEKILPMGHLAKLMTVLLAAEDIETGKISFDDMVTVSPNANSKQGTQIWLDIGEKISVSELMQSITIGNANDGCTALAEYLSGSEKDYLNRANKRAKRLGMGNTVFDDCCGMSENTVSTSSDMAKLTKELVRHKNLMEYFTTWMSKVRNQAVELVSTNRLIRSYKGILGFKSAMTEKSGECAAIAVNKGDFGVGVIIMKAESHENSADISRNILDKCFDEYFVYSPEISKDYLKKISVTGGQKKKISVKLKGIRKTLLRRGMEYDFSETCEIPEYISAPVKKGDVIAEVDYYNGDEKLIECQIVAAESVDSMNLGFAIKSCLFNLFNLKS